MRLAHLTASLFLAAAPLAPAPAQAPSGPAGDVADVATRICYGAASGALSLRFPDVSAEIAGIEALGLTYGFPRGTIDSLPPSGKAMINRATLASRANGGYRTLLAFGGTFPGCRVILTGAPDPNIVPAIAALLTAPSGGWTYVPELDRGAGAIARTGFIRRDPRGRTILLNLVALEAPDAKMRLAVLVAEMPPSVILPPAYQPLR